MDQAKKTAMLDFWTDRAKRFGADPRANTNDIWLREIEFGHVQQRLAETAAKQILDFGCANGYTTLRLAKANPGLTFVGIDINSEMIAAASAEAEAQKLRNVSFRVVNVLTDPTAERFDFIFTVRVFQNMESEAVQTAVLDKVAELLTPGGHLLLVETYAQRYLEFNEDRGRMGLSPLPTHPHLTLVPDSFDEYVKSRLEFIESVSLSSTYYLVTRLLYSYIAKESGEEIDYNHPIHQVGALLPQIGDYGPQKAGYYRKPLGT